MRLNRFAKLSWGVLIYNLLVVLWGAYVRATGSGAGCGSHWPLCNGEVLPVNPQIETMIEFAHRLSSGLAFLLVLALFILAMRNYPQGSTVRLGAGLAMFFIITEALVGAGLVLFEWVADNVSIGRVISMAVHLINTFLLLASLALTAWWSSGGQPVQIKGRRWQTWAFLIGFLGIILIGVTGAITALGDTVFPAESLIEGVRQDFSPTAHFLLRLRIWHPIISIMVGFYLMFLSGLTAMFSQDKMIKRIAVVLSVFFVTQFIAGLVNLILLAPVWMQIIHLLLADLVWITLVLFSANVFKKEALVVVEQRSIIGVPS